MIPLGNLLILFQPVSINGVSRRLQGDNLKIGTSVWAFVLALLLAAPLAAQELNLDTKSRAVIEQARKAAEKGGDLAFP